MYQYVYCHLCGQLVCQSCGCCCTPSCEVCCCPEADYEEPVTVAVKNMGEHFTIPEPK